VVSRTTCLIIGAAALSVGLVSTTMAATASVDEAAQVTYQAWRIDPPQIDRRSPTERAQHDLADLVNEHRAQRGLPGFRWNDQVAAAALAHATDMAEHENLNHIGSDGSNTGSRLDRAGYTWLSWGENIGAGFVDPAVLLDAWLSSEAHQRHLDGDLREIGVGVAPTSDGVLYWTLVLAYPR
jgi:uncharacterized protein YkwD